MNTNSFTIHEWLTSSVKALKAQDIATARLDCLVLLSDSLHLDKAQVLAKMHEPLPVAVQQQLDNQLARRIKQEPLAYIRGKTEFYGYTFKVNGSVLIPRPESEAMIHELLKLPASQLSRLADIGTGSGALGITAALKLPHTQVDLYDISASALAVVKDNIAFHKLDLGIYQGDLLSDMFNTYDAFLVNLPYVPLRYPISQSVMHEPVQAVFAGEDGLDLYRKFWDQLKTLGGYEPKYLLLESFPFQHEQQTSWAKENNYRLISTNDFIQVFERQFIA